jgi:hypothetical protein
MASAADGRGGPAGEDALGDFAADLGHFLGTVQNRAAGWLEQRKKIADQLTQIRDTANDYLRQLTGAESGRTAVRRGRPAAAQSAPASAGRGRKKRTMSAEARERIAEAQRRRWAKHRKAKAAGNA